jgi:hypothetical protein
VLAAAPGNPLQLLAVRGDVQESLVELAFVVAALIRSPVPVTGFLIKLGEPAADAFNVTAHVLILRYIYSPLGLTAFDSID